MTIATEIWLIIAVALAFDFINGFHDAANSIATVVSTRVLTPRAAVVWAAFFNFIAFLVFGAHVAKTIGKGVVDPAIVSPMLILAGLAGAIVWNLLTWWWGLPSSSSHALVGGYVGAALAKAGPDAVIADGVIRVAQFIVFSPLIGLTLGFLNMWIIMWIFHRSTPARVDRLFRKLQLVSAAAFSLGHGGNDAQKTMGIITALLFSTGHLTGEFKVPLWVILSAHAAMGLGTMAGGWRIVRTMGMRVTKLQPVGGFCAETAGAVTLFAVTALGIPVSTTHTITGAIVGVGATRRLSAVRWGVAGRIVWAWIFTIPMAAAISALTYKAIALFGAK
ncbi:MAG TPA: inorganic phosphate transporter [Candidatus Eisenbacteria bacterium]|nr:inorganic phosphate transporter [Candidatus Eisenbacteria bacterium]